MIANRVSDEWWNEGAKQRPGDAGKEATESDQQTSAVWDSRSSSLTASFSLCLNGEFGGHLGSSKLSTRSTGTHLSACLTAPILMRNRSTGLFEFEARNDVSVFCLNVSQY